MLCPSAIAEMKGSFVFGIAGTARLHFIHPMRTDEALAAIADTPAVSAAEVFRIAAPCVRCAHWTGEQCGLGARVVNLPNPGTAAEGCPIRTECRWLHEQGPAVCLACPDIITLNYGPLEAVTA